MGALTSLCWVNVETVSFENSGNEHTAMITWLKLKSKRWSVWRHVYWHTNPCSRHKDNLTTPENVLSSMCLSGEGVLFLEDGKIIFQRHFLKWVCLRWWITSELFFEALRISGNLCQKQIFFFFLFSAAVVLAILGKIPLPCFPELNWAGVRSFISFTQ